MATIKDVAKRAGVSIGTVSHVINNTAAVRNETKDRVLKAIKEFDYQPNSVARSLRSRRTGTISLVLPAIERSMDEPSYLSDLLASIVDESKRYNFDILLSASSSEEEEMTPYKRVVKGKMVDGCIITCTKRNDKRIAYLLSENIPFVAFGRSNVGLDFPYVDVDGEAGVYQGMHYLLDLGHTRIGFIGLPSELFCSEHRLKGYRFALKERGLKFDPALVIEGKTTQTGGYRSMKKLLNVDPPPTAVMISSDLMAFGAMKAAQEEGLIIGRDISIVGFDDVQMANNCHPPLTTIRQPIYKIGVLLCQMLVQLIRGEKLSERQIILLPELIVRESCGPIR
ncbi:MAG: LacI family transcriptional regulator [Thermotoga sp.]|nr:MAG: LacI family transcriptional regulator [Thermotoga sp.]